MFRRSERACLLLWRPRWYDRWERLVEQHSRRDSEHARACDVGNFHWFRQFSSYASWSSDELGQRVRDWFYSGSVGTYGGLFSTFCPLAQILNSSLIRFDSSEDCVQRTTICLDSETQIYCWEAWCLSHSHATTKNHRLKIALYHSFARSDGPSQPN